LVARPHGRREHLAGVVELREPGQKAADRLDHRHPRKVPIETPYDLSRCSPRSSRPTWRRETPNLTAFGADPQEQCKNGDWRNFPGFKNEGDCVSFVATGGKNPPATSP
jgi:hypothetical protein